MTELVKVTDCKSVGVGHHGFESHSSQNDVNRFLFNN